MSVLGAQERAKRRRVEASLLAGAVLAVIVLAVTAYAFKLAAALVDAAALMHAHS